jgi:hypothetical protein
MAIYGYSSVGASWIQFENRRRGVAITLASTETALRIRAYIRSVGTATNGTRATLYNYADGTRAYMSDVLAGFTDTGGSWHDYTLTSSISAGSYWLTIFSDGIAGGGNTVEIAYDAVSANSSLYESWFFDGTNATWPDQVADLDTVGTSGDGNTQRLSLYLETSSGASGIPRFQNVYSRRRRAA